jgi:tRNA(Ile)-lysidine synthase
MSGGRRPQDVVTEAVTAGLARFRGRAVVVGVSGGADSVALLRGALEVAPGLDLEIVAAHFDHQLRGAASEADAAFVGRLAADLGVPLAEGRWDVPVARGVEVAARRARLGWLGRLARERGAAALALAHTLDDQAETVLHRLVRGTGPRGLAGIPSNRRLEAGVELVRPLLGVRRAAVRAYLTSLDQAWREDASNRDTTRTRARIRRGLLPALERDYNPRVVEALGRLADLMREREGRVERHARRVLHRGCRPADENGVRIDLDLLRRLDPAVRAEVFRGLWRRAGWPELAMTRRHWERLASIVVAPDGRLSLPGGLRACVEGSELHVGPIRVPAVAPPPAALEVPGSAEWGGIRIVAEWEPSGGADEVVDADRVRFGVGTPSLLVREASAGERFRPLGLGGREQRVRDVLRSRGVTPGHRGGVPVVCDAEGVIWVVGHRIAERVARGPATCRHLGLWAGPADPGATPAIDPPGGPD